MPNFHTGSYTPHEHFDGKHRFEHWYRDNSVYFITARCRDRFPAFESEEAKAIFWDRFYYYTAMFGFIPWITSLLDNHYHTVGYLKVGQNLGPMMQRLHGSVAKLVNDLLPERHHLFSDRPTVTTTSTAACATSYRACAPSTTFAVSRFDTGSSRITMIIGTRSFI